jgi:hypothetical protein
VVQEVLVTQEALAMLGLLEMVVMQQHLGPSLQRLALELVLSEMAEPDLQMSGQGDRA